MLNQLKVSSLLIYRGHKVTVFLHLIDMGHIFHGLWVRYLMELHSSSSCSATQHLVMPCSSSASSILCIHCWSDPNHRSALSLFHLHLKNDVNHYQISTLRVWPYAAPLLFVVITSSASLALPLTWSSHYCNTEASWWHLSQTSWASTVIPCSWTYVSSLFWCRFPISIGECIQRGLWFLCWWSIAAGSRSSFLVSACSDTDLIPPGTCWGWELAAGHCHRWMLPGKAESWWLCLCRSSDLFLGSAIFYNWLNSCSRRSKIESMRYPNFDSSSSCWGVPYSSDPWSENYKRQLWRHPDPEWVWAQAWFAVGKTHILLCCSQSGWESSGAFSKISAWIWYSCGSHEEQFITAISLYSRSISDELICAWKIQNQWCWA